LFRIIVLPFPRTDFHTSAPPSLTRDILPTYLRDFQHHDLYQKAEDHQRFIAENQDNWKSVRVFDTYVK